MRAAWPADMGLLEMTTADSAGSVCEDAAARAVAPWPRVAATARGASGEIVHGALGCPSLDESAQQDICTALLSTPGLDARHIAVEMTSAGVVLRGTIARAADRAWALGIATRIAAPRPVQEVLTVLPSPEVDASRVRAPRRPEAADAE